MKNVIFQKSKAFGRNKVNALITITDTTIRHNINEAVTHHHPWLVASPD